MSSEKEKKGKDIFDLAIEGLGTAIEMAFVLIFSCIVFLSKSLIKKFSSKNQDKEDAGLSPICAKIAKEHKETVNESN